LEDPGKPELYTVGLKQSAESGVFETKSRNIHQLRNIYIKIKEISDTVELLVKEERRAYMQFRNALFVPF